MMYDIISLPCPFCGATVDDILSEHTDQCYFTLNDELQNGPASAWTRDSVNKVNSVWNMRDNSEINHLKQLLRNVRATLHFSPEDVLAIDTALREDDICSKVNQCDGCQAGIPLINGTHRMGEPDGYANKIKCTAHLYK